MKQEMKNERRKHIEVRRKLVEKLEYRKLTKDRKWYKTECEISKSKIR